MKILILTNLYPPQYIGGYELICQTVVEELRARGHLVTILTSNYAAPGTQPSGPESGTERRLRIHGLFGHPWLSLWQLRRLEEHNNGVVRRALDQFRPDLVYVWNMGGLGKSMLFTLERMSVPTVFFVSDHWITRGLPSDVWLRWWNSASLPWTRRAVRVCLNLTGLRAYWSGRAPTHPVSQLEFHRIYFCSRALLESTVAAGFPVGHGAVIHSPVHPRYLKVTPAEPRRDLTRLLYVGRLTEDKGVGTALRAVALLRGKVQPRLSIYGAGDGAYVGQLKSFCQKHDLEVTFASAGLEEMAAVYQNHDLLLFPSEWQEPFALTPLEAMACGLPVVGTTTGGSAELFRHRENALTFTPGSAQELAARIWELSSDYSLRERCARTGCADARQRYAAPVIVNQIERYLDETLRMWPTRSSAGRSPRRRLPSNPRASKGNGLADGDLCVRPGESQSIVFHE